MCFTFYHPPQFDKCRTGSDPMNEDATLPCLLFCHQKDCVNNLYYLTENNTTIPHMVSEYEFIVLGGGGGGNASAIFCLWCVLKV